MNAPAIDTCPRCLVDAVLFGDGEDQACAACHASEAAAVGGSSDSRCAVCGRDSCDNPQHLPPGDRAGNGGTRPPLEFLTVRALAEQVAAAGGRRWLARGWIPSRTYGVIGGPPKAQKSMLAVDLAVSVAGGVAWLGHVPIDDPGPVVLFYGEGGRAGVLRRIRAVAEARGLVAEDLPLFVCTRAPHLNNDAHLALMAQQLAETQPRLVELDPLYLSTPGAKGSDLNAMGPLLERVQHLAEDAGSTLVLVSHFNRREGKGLDRLTGAGPAEWARFIITATVVSRRTDPATRATDVTTELELIGGEVPERTLRVRRRTWSDDPDDLDSPLRVEVTAAEDEPRSSSGDELKPGARLLLAALQALREGDVQSLNDWLADNLGKPLRRETTSRSMAVLVDRGLATAVDSGRFETKRWRITPEGASYVVTV